MKELMMLVPCNDYITNHRWICECIIAWIVSFIIWCFTHKQYKNYEQAKGNGALNSVSKLIASLQILSWQTGQHSFNWLIDIVIVWESGTIEFLIKQFWNHRMTCFKPQQTFFVILSDTMAKEHELFKSDRLK